MRFYHFKDKDVSASLNKIVLVCKNYRSFFVLIINGEIRQLSLRYVEKQIRYISCANEMSLQQIHNVSRKVNVD